MKHSYSESKIRSSQKIRHWDDWVVKKSGLPKSWAIKSLSANLKHYRFYWKIHKESISLNDGRFVFLNCLIIWPEWTTQSYSIQIDSCASHEIKKNVCWVLAEAINSLYSLNRNATEWQSQTERERKNKMQNIKSEFSKSVFAI